MGYLYHGSSESKIKRLEPRQSTHGNYVYATPYKELAIIFSGRAGDDMTYSLFRNSSDEPWQLVERVPMGFEVMFNNGSSIYTLSDASFKNIKTGFAEVVSEVGVDTLKEEKIDNVYQKLEELDTKGIIKLYRYPNRPNSIPLDDSDLIEKELKHATRENRPITQETFERLLLLHPKLLEKVNYIACLKNNDFVPFKKEDLIDIFEKFLLMQMIYPSKEYFIKSALKEILEFSPEFSPILQEKIDLLKKSKEEKIAVLISAIFKLTSNASNVPRELIEEEKIKYMQDGRSFSEIAQEILEEYKKISITDECALEKTEIRPKI